MATLLDILWVLLATIGVIAALALVMPLSVSARGEASFEELSATFEVRVRWALGVLGLDIGPTGQTVRLFGVRVWRSRPGRDASDDENPRDRARKSPRRSRKRNNGPLWFWQNRDALLRALLRLVSTLHLRGRVEGAVGLSEPDDTIWLALAIHALAARLPEGTLDLDVDYTDLTLEVSGRLSAWVVPLHVAAVGLALVTFDRTTRHAVFGAPAQKIPLTGETP